MSNNLYTAWYVVCLDACIATARALTFPWLYLSGLEGPAVSRHKDLDLNIEEPEKVIRLRHGQDEKLERVPATPRSTGTYLS